MFTRKIYKDGMKVKCISTTPSQQFTKNRQYYIDYRSIFIDEKGVTRGNFYDLKGYFVDSEELRFFKTLHIDVCFDVKERRYT